MSNSLRTQPCLVVVFLSVLSVLARVSSAGSSAVADNTVNDNTSDRSASEFFDRTVAPLLTRKCLGCHDSTSKKGGLDLSSAASVMAGGDSGPVIRADSAADSLIWQRVAAGEMPPKEPLTSEDKAILNQWITSGAVWGSGPLDPFQFSTESRGGYDWWSLRPVTQPDLPPVKQVEWPRNELDRFTLSKLEAAGLSPAESADARTLLRRLYVDLIGLPPILSDNNGTVKEELLDIEIDLSAFREEPEAWSQVVEQLLASPHYGERWARHWLDVIRFGESQGFERNRIRENAWRYRDWVIDAFNSDLPYDEFVRQQIAGDALYPDDLNALLATGFLVCGTWDQVGHKEGSAEMQMAVRQDHLEDLVGALGQSFLGLTTNCARCHDHKFDPISQREYYQLAAALGGVTQEENERQGITAKSLNDEYHRWASARDQHLEELQQFEQTVRVRYGDQKQGNPVDGLQVLYRPDSAGGKLLRDESDSGLHLDLKSGSPALFATAGPATKFVAAIKSSNEFSVEVWLTSASDSQKGPARIITLSQDSGRRNFTLGQDGSRFDLRLRTTKTDQNGMPSLATPDRTVTTRKTHVVFTFDSNGDVTGYVDGKAVASRHAGGDLSGWSDEFRLALGDELTGDRRWNGQLHFVALYHRALTAGQIARNFETESRDVRAGESLEVLLTRSSADERTRYQSLRESLQHIEQNEPTQPLAGVAHVIIPRQPPVFHVLARGDYRNPMDVVSPAGLKAVSVDGLSADFGLNPDAPEAERRVALARWITDPRNPLTPRVLVNRLWHHHFGRGIVDTPSDLGFAGGRPSHPELLDWLVKRFVDGGWRIKDIHRLIVHSATWRQASNVGNTKAQEVDADNRLLWRASARRLDGESSRDAMLTVSGTLNRRQGGPSYRDIKVSGGVMGTNSEFTEPTNEFSEATCRRTIYRLWARSGNNPLLESLDCADPSVSAPRRAQTITPIQSLSLLNSSFVEHCAKHLADRVRSEAGTEMDHQLDRLYQRTLGRSPKPSELEWTRQLAQQRGLEQVALVLLNTNEFLFVE